MLSRCLCAATVLLAAMVAAPLVSHGAEAPDPVVGIVNGAQIHQSEVMQAYEVLPANYRALPIATLFPMLLNSLIDGHLAAAAARKQGLQNAPEVKEALAQAENRALEQAYFDRALGDRVSDEAVRKRYDEMAKNNLGEDEVRARHVLLATEAEAMQVVAELDKGGDFAAIAERSSTGPSAAQGGDLGYFTKAKMVPAFANAAFALKSGEYTKAPVQTQFGWHIILAVDRRQAALASFDELAEGLRNEMRQEIGRQIIGDLRRGAAIERFNIDGSPVAPAPKKE
jgi:peptidyl-prolyl cis-trans isomerase C